MFAGGEHGKTCFPPRGLSPARICLESLRKLNYSRAAKGTYIVKGSMKSRVIILVFRFRFPLWRAGANFSWDGIKIARNKPLKVVSHQPAKGDQNSIIPTWKGLKCSGHDCRSSMKTLEGLVGAKWRYLVGIPFSSHLLFIGWKTELHKTCIWSKRKCMKK